MKFTIVGSGRHLPERVVLSTEVDQHFNLEPGETQRRTGIAKRHFYDEGTSKLAAKAVTAALNDAQLTYQDLDLLICASGTFEQPIPCTASLIAEHFLAEDHPIPCFDVNATCLSFISACEIAQSFLTTGRYSTILIVSAEAGDDALDPEEFESSALIGNASAAFIFSTAKQPKAQYDVEVLGARFMTYPEYAHAAEIKAGGSADFIPENEQDRYFHMDGFELIKAMRRKLPDFLSDLLAEAQVEIKAIDFVVPHQASGPGMKIAGRLAKFSDKQLINIIEETGNTIAASIPFTFEYLLKREEEFKEKIVLLLGTGAGMSIGGQLLRISRR
ncbi:hypothetical protein JZO66_02660 [Enterococcus sp. DIV0242_7C1]|uniref:3-oxoacyl-[acyl-carrier-protein] synthase III n=1 Tax=Candidatus Enterococcus dunnyi TaxID=1834192 RepID=A0A200JES0_9ENTE|nr:MULTISPECIES: 3-oxoacyl-[acyl-carrier-protein] synthase III C-terminal domain-containing protein [unclassified Enterococcus]MBO0469434.1 hypothetical protein [Enterococcus sp. DIV0242_7C1]OUZ35270.1 hypothetical protein A5889_000746 [Enterococcus sp. 9D6_DIV0238]